MSTFIGLPLIGVDDVKFQKYDTFDRLADIIIKAYAYYIPVHTFYHPFPLHSTACILFKS